MAISHVLTHVAETTLGGKLMHAVQGVKMSESSVAIRKLILLWVMRRLIMPLGALIGLGPR